MARYEHLRLRLPELLERRKRPGFGAQRPSRNRGEHAARLTSELDEAIAVQQRRRRPQFVTPSLILRVQMAKTLLEDQWEALGLTVLSSDADRTLVLFSSSDDMRELRERFAAWAGDIPAGQHGARYGSFVPFIESIGTVSPRDRIGPRLREEGFTETDDFASDESMLLDVELWDLGERAIREQRVREIGTWIAGERGEVVDEYIGPSITMVRVRAPGSVIREMLALEDVASVDRPPVPDVTTGEALVWAAADPLKRTWMTQPVLTCPNLSHQNRRRLGHFFFEK